MSLQVLQVLFENAFFFPSFIFLSRANEPKLYGDVDNIEKMSKVQLNK
jgi:hypothetical protein